MERAFRLLEQVAEDPSTAVRSCVIKPLEVLVQQDLVRTLTIFERALNEYSQLLQTQPVHRYLYRVCNSSFLQVRRFIEALLKEPDEESRQAGARLACLAAFQYVEAHGLEEQVMQGDVVLRRGAAQVYARNLEFSDVEVTCRERLLQLMQDSDEQVCTEVGECFRYLQPHHLDSLRFFVEQFLASPALLASDRHLINYLKPLACNEHDLVLHATACILDAVGNEVVDIRTARAALERDLVQLPLTVYTYSDSQAVKARAMVLFERLLSLGSREAQAALATWDRK
jgi:hypothetical protein